MSATKILWGQVITVFLIVLIAVWAATQWTAAALPFFMLVAHALELSLKAVLSADGADEERLMGIGHELGWCLQLVRRTRRYPKEAFSELVRLVDALSMPHAFQAFRYPQPFRWTLPEPLAASELLQRHLDVVAEAITSNRARSSL